MLSDDLTSSATGRPQLNSRHQILLTFNRLLTYGDGTSIGCIARKFGVSEGSAAKGCIGFVDGTLFSFHQVPASGPDYYSRKGRYGLSGMIVCDDRKKSLS